MKSKRLGLILIIAALLLTAAAIIIQKKVSDSPYFFVQVTDPQFGFIEPENGFEKETELFEKAVAAINTLKPKFVVITGDFVQLQGDSSQIAEFKRISAMIDTDIPVYQIPGNHDIGQAPEQKDIDRYISDYGDPRFSFRFRKTNFIGINSTLIKANTPVLEQEQFDWLKNELSMAEKAKQVIIFSHHPFFIKQADEADNYSNITTETRYKYINLFNEYRVNAIFAGHTHSNGFLKAGDM